MVLFGYSFVLGCGWRLMFSCFVDCGFGFYAFWVVLVLLVYPVMFGLGFGVLWVADCFWWV